MGCSHISRPTFTAHTDLNLVFLRSFHQGLSSKISLNRKEVFTRERSAGNWGPVCSIVGSRSCKRHREGAGAWLRSRHESQLDCILLLVLVVQIIFYSNISTYAHQVLQCLVLPPVILFCSNLLLNSSIAPCQAGSGHAAPLISPPQAHRSLLGLGQKGIFSFSLNSC